MSQQICKHYQNGTCRFGQACRNLHPVDNPLTGSPGSNGFGNNNFGNTRQAGFSAGYAGGGQLKIEGFNLTQDSIKTDLTERPTWFLSSYAPGKDPPSQLIDGKDVSPEEARVLAYKCRAEGNPGVYEAEWQRLTSEADAQIKNILNDLPGAVNFMKNAYENRTSSRYNASNPSPNFGSTTPQPPPFGNTDQTIPPFGQPPQQPISAFSQSSQPTSAFSQISQPTSAFNQPQQTSVFGQPPPQSTSAFGQPLQPTSVFGAASSFATRPSPAFGQSAFSQTPTAPAFGQPSFGPSTASTSQAQGTFGQPAFGQSSLLKPTFGQPAFGQPAFGQPVALGQAASPFGVPASVAQQPTSAFSQVPPFGTSSTPKPTFGQPAFGQPPFAQGPSFGAPALTSQGQPQVALPFGQPQQNQLVNSPFSQTPNSNNSTTQNVFQQATVSPFSNSNPFQQGHQATVQQAQPASGFSQPSQLVSAFGQPTAPVSTFGTPQQNSSGFGNQNPFQSIHQIQPPSHQVNPQLREAQRAKKWDDPVIDYIQAETDAFTAPNFTLGSVPTVAPSREMCWA